MKRLKVQGKKIVNEQGNEVILYGINMVCKDKSKGYIGGYEEEDIKKLKEWGFNVIRLGVIWDGVEPKPNKYNEEYIAALESVIKLAYKYEIYVYLDMHQDLYSAEYADGAPQWATLTEGKEHIQTELWNESYLLSEAVKTAFTNFWENKEIEGQGVQEYYCNAFKYVAMRLGKYENVIGFDLMNEPAPGKITDQIIGAMMMAYKDLVLKDNTISLEQVMELWMGEASDGQVMQDLQDMTIYKEVVKRVEEVLQAFDQDYLMPFYNKVARVLHEVSSEGIMFFESSYFSNMGMKSGVKKIENQIPCIYAPHGYDLVVDTNNYSDYNFERVEFIFDTHRKVQEELQVPTLIGEWGAFYNMKCTTELAKHIVKILEKYHWSSTYWDYAKGMEEFPVLEGLIRAYPQTIGGNLQEYSYDYETQQFEMTYISAQGGQTRIYHPKAKSVLKEAIKVNAKGKVRIDLIDEQECGYIIVWAEQGDEEIKIVI